MVTVIEGEEGEVAGRSLRRLHSPEVLHRREDCEGKRQEDGFVSGGCEDAATATFFGIVRDERDRMHARMQAKGQRKGRRA